MNNSFYRSLPVAVVVLVGISSLAAQDSQKSHPLDPGIEMAEASLKHIQSDVRD